MSLSIEEIKHIAKLSKLEFTEEELQKFSKEFNNILEYISMIKECDTTGIEFEHNMQDFKGSVLQEDIAENKSEEDKKKNKQKMLQNATEGRERFGYIKTSKIVSKE